MNDKLLNKMFMTALWVNVFSILMAVIGVSIDGLLIARYFGADAIAGYGLNMPLLSFNATAAGILPAGIGVFVAKYTAMGDRKTANDYFHTVLISSVGLSSLLALMLLLFSEHIVAWLGAAAGTAVFGCADDYLRGMSISFPFLAFVLAAQPAAVLCGRKNLVYKTGLITTAANIIADILNIFVLKQGMLGMGLCTSLANGLAAGIILRVFLRDDIYLKIGEGSFAKDKLAEIIKVGLPNAVYSISCLLRALIYNKFLLVTGGVAAVAGFAVMSNINNIASSLVGGIRRVMLMLMGIALGEEDRQFVKRLSKVGFLSCLKVLVPVSVIVFLTSPWLADLYLQESGAPKDYAVTAIRCFAVSLTFWGINAAICNYLQGSMNVTLANAGFFLDFAVYTLLLNYFLSDIWGVNGIFCSLIFSELLTLLSLYGAACVKRGRVLRSWDELLLLPDGFGIDPEDMREITVTSMDEVMAFADEAFALCRSKGIEQMMCYSIVLAIEEMAGNVITYGFSDGKKHSLDIGVAVKEKEYIILRMRDDCRPFNPDEQIQHTDDKDATSNLGLRIIYKMMDDISYNNSLNMNNLIIRIRL